MTEALIHIGYHKTATTWFQQVYYPLARDATYVPRAVVRQAFLQDGAFTFDPARARALIDSHTGGAARLVLCEEGLSGYPHNGAMMGCLSKEVAGRLKATLPEARIVIFIRAQAEAIAATYQQYLRGGGTHRPHRYLFPYDYLYGAIAQPHKVPRFSFDHFAYDRLIACYEELFGADRVHVFLYEAFRRDPVDFLADYGRRLDLDVPPAAVSLKPRNRSYSQAVLGLARLLNHFTSRTVQDKQCLVHIPGWYGARGKLLEGLSRVGRPPSAVQLLGPETVTWIAQQFWESNLRLVGRLGLPLARCGYPVDPPVTPVERPRAAPWHAWLAR